MAPATAPGPARLAPSSRAQIAQPLTAPGQRLSPPSLPPWAWAAPGTLRRALRIAGAGSNSSRAPLLGRAGAEGAVGAVGCYPVLAPAPAATAQAAPANFPSETAHHVPPPWPGWPARGWYRGGRGSRYKPDGPKLAPERLWLSEILIHPSRPNHDNMKTNQTESVLQPAAGHAAPPCSCGHRKPGRGKEARWETSCGSRGLWVKQNYPEPTPRGKAAEVHSSPSSTGPPPPLHLTLQIANLIRFLLGDWGTS